MLVRDRDTADASAVPAAPAAGEIPDRGGLYKPGKRYGQLAKRGVVWSFFREGVSEMMTTPTAMILARLLTPFDFGIAASAGFFLTLATRATNFGFAQALVRIKHLRPEHCSSVFVVNLITGTLIYTVLASTSNLMAAFFHAPALSRAVPVAALSFLITPLGTVPSTLMVRNLQFRLTAATDWIGGLAEAIAAISLAFAGFGYWSLVYARLVGTVFNVGAKIAFGRWVPSLRFSRAAIGELFSFASGLFAKRLLDYAANNLDNLVVGRTLGIVSLGFYDKAFVTMNKVLMRINTGGPGVSFRIFSLIYEDPERFRRAYRRVLLATSLMSFPLLVALSASAHDLIVVLYGPRWAPAVVPFQVLCAAAALKIINEYAGSAAQAVGKIWGQVWRQAVYALMIVICVAAFRFWGLRGAAFGVLVATVVMTLLMYGLLVRLTGMRAADLAIPALPGIVAAVGTAGVELLVRAAILSVHPAARHWELLFVELAAGATFYAAYLKFHPSRQVRTLLREVAADLAPPIGTVARFLA